MIDIYRSYHRVRRAFLGDYGVRTIQLLTHHRLACLLLLLLLLLAVQLDDPAHVTIIHYKFNCGQRHFEGFIYKFFRLEKYQLLYCYRIRLLR